MLRLGGGGITKCDPDYYQNLMVSSMAHVSNCENPLSNEAVREAATICPCPCKLTFDLLTLQVVSESCVTWATYVPIIVFLCLSVLDLGPMYATDRQTSDAHHRLMPSTLGAGAYKVTNADENISSSAVITSVVSQFARW